MSPTISYHLSNVGYDRFAESLLPYGVTVRDTRRYTSENLELGLLDSDSCTGFLRFREFEFRYHRHKSANLTAAPSPDTPHIRVYTTYFDVDWTDNDWNIFEELEDVLTTAFPQPKRLERVFKPLPPVKARIKERLGCLLGIVLFSTVCFFIIYGFCTFFSRS